MVLLNKRMILVFVLACISFIHSRSTAYAGVYDNAYTYYQKYGGSNSDIARLNTDDGCIYFVSKGTTATSKVRYRTVGYTIKICIGNQKDAVEVKLDGKYIKTVSVKNQGKYTYVLRKVNLNKLKLLFNGNADITWNQIFRYKNTYEFNAIMTVAENDKSLCGEITETQNYRRISAKKNTYLFRNAAGIKNARKWANPDDLNNFYDKYISFDPVESLKADTLRIEASDNVYQYGDQYYVRKDSDIDVYVESQLNNTESAAKEYQPDYNMIKASGWGNDQIFYMAKMKTGARCKAGIISEEGKKGSPLTYKKIIKEKCNGTDNSIIDFKSCIRLGYNVPDGKYINLIPEARIYYGRIYPDKLSDIDNLCEQDSNSAQKRKLVSDGKGPEISAVPVLLGYGFLAVPFTVADSGAGIRSIDVYCEDGRRLISNDYSGSRTTYICSDNDYQVNAEEGKEYYILAYDNVGNMTRSNNFKFSVPKAHVIKHSYVTGYNGYNCEEAVANVYGGNSDIARLLIMSEAEDNPDRNRIVYVNMDVGNRTLASGLKSLTYKYNPMDRIRGLKDGKYWIDVISGGRYASSEPQRYCIEKDTTPPIFRYFNNSIAYDGWSRNRAVFTISATDGYSGVDCIEAVCDGEVISGRTFNNQFYQLNKEYKLEREGYSTVDVKVYDKAHNCSTGKLMFKVDSTKPECLLSEEFMGMDIVKNKWVNAAGLNGKVFFWDRLSGFGDASKFIFFRGDSSGMWEDDKKNYDIVLSDNNNAQVMFKSGYSKSIPSGRHRFRFEAEDKVGNVRFVHIYLNVDKEAPVVNTDVSKPWSIKKKKGNFHVYDAHSGIDSIELMAGVKIVDSVYGVGSNEYVMYCDLSSYDTGGRLTYLHVTDVAGNSYDYPVQTSHSEKPLWVKAEVVRADDNGTAEFISNENALLNLSAWAYADKVEIMFPKGLEQYNEVITPEDEYTFNHSIQFVIPPDYNGKYKVKVKAYRDAAVCSSEPGFSVTRSSLYNVRTRIRRR